ncbi:hypothetical protein EYC59_05175 [Candidatus Saccharibacteria bacterium]|nr:MAG: hypothetical protein EYC59_05175 [Candidatus Saccharibacteria bacterium]
MLYNDLVRLNAIDQEIMQQLQRLSALYEERGLIMKLPAPANASEASSLEQRYENLVKKWSSLGVTTPEFDAMKPKLTRALALAQTASDSGDMGMDIILVPPTKLLLAAMQHNPAPAVDVQSYKDLRLKPTYAWHCAVIKSTADRQPVEDLRLFLRNRTASDAFANLDTGAHMVAAAYLQGIHLVEKGTWNLLLADMTSLHEVPCARLVNDCLRFSFDDSAGFLGQNYYYPSALIKTGKKT